MRRTTRRAVVHLGLFSSVLFLLLYLNRPHPNEPFAWSTIRYRSPASSSSSAPEKNEARGICPGLRDSSKPALVVSRVSADGDAAWLDALAQRYHLCVYTADAPRDETSRHLQVPANRAHEAMAYLTFMVDNYDAVPAAGAVFVHGSRFAWHNDAPDYDNAALLAALNISAALEPWGYHNLRCDWSASTCPSGSASQGSLETSFLAVLQPWDARTASDRALPAALATLFGGEDTTKVHLGRTETVRSQCCAQFVVSRERIWQHSRDEYAALRQWLLDGSDESITYRGNGAAPRDDRVAGRIVSYLWHILFLQHPEAELVDLDVLNKLACPRADECYCRLYGRCDLPHCLGPDSCRGQYSIPKDFKLPDDWAATHP